jgi:hypothetical protein
MIEMGSEKTQVANKIRKSRRKSKKNKEGDCIGEVESYKNKNRDAT